MTSQTLTDKVAKVREALKELSEETENIFNLSGLARLDTGLSGLYGSMYPGEHEYVDGMCTFLSHLQREDEYRYKHEITPIAAQASVLINIDAAGAMSMFRSYAEKEYKYLDELRHKESEEDQQLYQDQIARLFGLFKELSDTGDILYQMLTEHKLHEEIKENEKDGALD